ncbi:family integral membrane protein [Rhizoctonia solani]|uniref:Family integral membrane protein n=1 Tax=Rhizoctonia solani TaxID=456999 RepID=A0A8H7HDP6_9AGAM|nr:family integral membrane protein [Rhizoctonia solani]
MTYAPETRSTSPNQLLEMPFTPIQSLIGATPSVSAYHVLILNGGVLGVSGFAHRTASWFIFKHRKHISVKAHKGDTLSDVNPDPEYLALISIVGLLAGGLVLGLFYQPLETQLQTQLVDIYSTTSVTQAQRIGLALAGFLVGMGSKLSNGCTSGHMLCGVSRLAPRSLLATATFFPVGVLTHLLLGQTSLFSTKLVVEGPIGRPTWQVTLLLQLPILFYRYGAAFVNDLTGGRYARQVVAFMTSFHFALGLIASGMLRPSKILNFLHLTPTAMKDGTWDPSLAMIILAGILPQAFVWLASLRKHVRQAGTRPKFSETWNIPMPVPEWRKGVDARLIIGAALFGIGWGMCGICPGPAIVLSGAGISGGIESHGWMRIGVWIVGFVSGGLMGRIF